jgi:hypothetical protein
MLLTIHELDIDKVAGNKLRQALDEGDVPAELRDSATLLTHLSTWPGMIGQLTARGERSDPCGT